MRREDHEQHEEHEEHEDYEESKKHEGDELLDINPAGFLESIYQKAMGVELAAQRIPYECEQAVTVVS